MYKIQNNTLIRATSLWAALLLIPLTTVAAGLGANSIVTRTAIVSSINSDITQGELRVSGSRESPLDQETQSSATSVVSERSQSNDDQEGLQTSATSLEQLQTSQSQEQPLIASATPEWLQTGAIQEQSQISTDKKPYKKPVNPAKLGLKSSSLIVYDPISGEVLLERQSDKVRPIASLTKLMTAMVVLDSGLPMDEVITVAKDDIDRLRHSRSKLPVGTQLTRRDMLQLALAASENRAAAALARTFPGGTAAFVEEMNIKARSLGLEHTRYVDSTGLHDKNVSTAADLVKLTIAANEYPQIKEMSTNGKDYVVDLRRNRKIEFRNTNRLVRDDNWEVNLSKTGYIMSAGYCLVMHTIINDRPLAMILLNSKGKYSKFGDANRIKKWLMKVESHRAKISS